MKITKSTLKQLIKEELTKVLNEINDDPLSSHSRRGGSFAGYVGGGDVSVRSDEVKDAFEHRGVKVPFSLQDEGLDSNKLREMGFEYDPHDDDLMDFLRMDTSNPYAYTQGFWYDPKDDWREARMAAAGEL
tara:strand:+ start:291 stop:683 length:393 start_codon:yes stop_codon:yes gene_type:complete